MVYKQFKSALSEQLKANWTPQITSPVFKLHYKFTYIIFMVSVLLTTIYDVIGDKIKCMTDLNQKVVENYCYIMGTFTVDHLHNATVGVDVPHPGVGLNRPGDAITVHSYYQWVPFVLLFN
ncbi:unnamed protein product, partial [Meganyctiphanes norvegica]